jgi:hypothetical protein
MKKSYQFVVIAVLIFLSILVDKRGYAETVIANKFFREVKNENSSDVFR